MRFSIFQFPITILWCAHKPDAETQIINQKLIETGKNGGKNSAAHEASITGDTVGDPFKDAAGPSLHVVIKLLSTITLVMCPLFVSPIGGGGN